MPSVSTTTLFTSASKPVPVGKASETAAAVSVRGWHAPSGPAGLKVATRLRQGTQVKAVPLLPPVLVFVVSRTVPVVATTRIRTVRLVADWLTKFVVPVPVPKRTPVTLPRFVLMKVTLVPVGSLAGAKLVMVWA